MRGLGREAAKQRVLPDGAENIGDADASDYLVELVYSVAAYRLMYGSQYWRILEAHEKSGKENGAGLSSALSKVESV